MTNNQINQAIQEPITAIPNWEVATESHAETIICPKCERQQVATVEHTYPWHSYVHFCECGYIVMESEWEVVTA